MMRKKACIVIVILSSISLLNGVSHMIEGIRMRGLGGVNYGSVIFPLLIGIGDVCFSVKSKK